MTKRLVVVAFAAAALAGCDEGTRQRNSDAAALAATLRLRIGVVDGPDEFTLSRVFSGFLRDGKIFVANGTPPEIRVFDTSGRFLQRIGRSGSGPGEFRRLTWIAPVGPDSLVALDGDLSRVTIFDQTGHSLQSFTLDRSDHGSLEWIGVIPDGFAIAVRRGIDPRTFEIGSVMRDSLSVAMIGRDGTMRDGASPMLGARWWRREEMSGAVRIVALDNGPYPLLAAVPGAVAVSPSDSRIVLRWSGGPWEALALEGNSGATENRRTDDVLDRLYDHMVIDDQGQVWLGGVSSTESDVRTWWVHDSQGVLVSTLELPARFVIWQAGEGWLLGRQTDEHGIEYVELWELSEQAPVAMPGPVR